MLYGDNERKLVVCPGRHYSGEITRGEEALRRPVVNTLTARATCRGYILETLTDCSGTVTFQDDQKNVYN
jgi:hypothetical protein